MGINAKSSIKSSSYKNEVKHSVHCAPFIISDSETADTGFNYLYAHIQRIIFIVFQNCINFNLNIYLYYAQCNPSLQQNKINI